MIDLASIGWPEGLGLAVGLATIAVLMAFNLIGFACRRSIRRDRARLGRGDVGPSAPGRERGRRC